MSREREIPVDLRDSIKARIQEFDVVALILLLEELGFDRAHIRYLGNFTSTPQPRLLDSIDFQGEDEPHPLRRPIDVQRLEGRGKRAEEIDVTVTLNLGLVSNRSPLPSYFQELLADPDYAEPLAALLDLLDGGLLRERIDSFRPERARKLVPDWGRMKRDMLRLTCLRAPSTLRWLFQQIFPELGVVVRRAPARRPMRVPSVCLGSARMGTAAFGGEAEVQVYGLEVTLICDDPESYAGEPWPVEAKARLKEQAFPALRGAGVHLTVVLLMHERASSARFNDASYVGYNPLSVEVDNPVQVPERIVIWSGAVPGESLPNDTEKDTGARAGVPPNARRARR
ncbi:hypothetical protein WME99_12575 [Sorangium sp. So ce136]|uniref:hypothetical protein n=1 Tax=Sorangium sp. So ce136 TaxID=3133284 RepID=UPI003F0ADD51